MNFHRGHETLLYFIAHFLNSGWVSLYINIILIKVGLPENQNRRGVDGCGRLGGSSGSPLQTSEPETQLSVSYCVRRWLCDLGLSLPSLKCNVLICKVESNPLNDGISTILSLFSMRLRGRAGALTKRRENPDSETEGDIKHLFKATEQGLFAENDSYEDQLKDLIGEQDVGEAVISFSFFHKQGAH